MSNVETSIQSVTTMVAGRINPNGIKITCPTGGFASSERNSEGNYSVTFSFNYKSHVTVVVTPIVGDTPYVATVTSVSISGFTVLITDLDGNPSDSFFSFVAVEQVAS